MKDSEKNNEMENLDENEEMEDLVVFEGDDGEEYSFTVEDYFFYNGEEYALLADADSDEDDEQGVGCIICRMAPTENEDEEEFVPVEDEELAQKLFEIATTKLDAEKEEED